MEDSYMIEKMNIFMYQLAEKMSDRKVVCQN